MCAAYIRVFEVIEIPCTLRPTVPWIFLQRIGTTQCTLVSTESTARLVSEFTCIPFVLQTWLHSDLLLPSSLSLFSPVSFLRFLQICICHSAQCASLRLASLHCPVGNYVTLNIFLSILLHVCCGANGRDFICVFLAVLQCPTLSFVCRVSVMLSRKGLCLWAKAGRVAWTVWTFSGG